MSSNEDDIRQLVDLEINYVYDFRSHPELVSDGQKDFPHAQVTHIDILPDAGMDESAINKFLKNPQKAFDYLYGEAFPQSSEYSQFIQSVIIQDTPGLLFHCTGGRDRTGIAGVILMYVLNFKLEDIYEEYLEMNQDIIHALGMKIGGLSQKMGVSITRKELEALMIPKRRELEAFFEGVRRVHGGFEAYLTKFLGISTSDQDTLKNTYLTQ